MGIKTITSGLSADKPNALKNLPTTWGLRRCQRILSLIPRRTLKNLPTTWGLRR